MSLFPRGACLVWPLALLVGGVVPAVAAGTSIITRPRVTIVLEDGKRFIAQDGWTSLALYRIADGSVVYCSPAPAEVHGAVAVSPDEKHLLVACSDGSLLLWR